MSPRPPAQSRPAPPLLEISCSPCSPPCKVRMPAREASAWPWEAVRLTLSDDFGLLKTLICRLPILGSSGGGSKPPPSRFFYPVSIPVSQYAFNLGPIAPQQKVQPDRSPFHLATNASPMRPGLPPMPTQHYKLESAAMGREQDGWGGKWWGQEHAAVYSSSSNISTFRTILSNQIEPSVNPRTRCDHAKMVRAGSTWFDLAARRFHWV
ncbi:hypothetical protein B0H19DRAFT_1067574 [Mycena capillaripes]|nr:hypothetical protein B0H19DRAFT_1067574 [Mycena capillaripes]